MNVKTLSQLVAADELQGKRVFIRSDLNVPLDGGGHGHLTFGTPN